MANNNVTPTSHLERVIAGQVEPVTHLELIIAQYMGTGGGSGTGGNATLTKDITANIDVGNTKAGYVFKKGTDFDTYVQSVHVTYLKPGISISINPSTTVYEIGTSIPTLKITANLTKNSYAIKSTEFYVGSTVVNTDTSQTTTGTVSYDYTTAINTDTTIKAVVNDGSTNTTSNLINIKFVNPMYVGVASGTLTKLVRVKGNYTYSNITCTNDNVVFKYPASYGNLTSILDPNGFENLSSFTKTTETINSVAYNVYTSGKATLNGFSYTFKF